MTLGGDPAPLSGRRLATVAAAAAVLLGGLYWGLSRPARPPLPSSDLYTHLSVARHLARAEGYRTDCAYPLSFAYPFARELPQPLVHRMPGYGTLLTVPWVLSGRHADGAVGAVRGLQILLVLAMVGLGSFTLVRRGSVVGVPFWLILMGTSTLLGFAVDWGQDEVLAGLLLLAIWLPMRSAGSRSPLFTGTLTGLLALVRLELFWLPLVWWIRGRAGDRNLPGKGGRFGLMLAMAVVVLIPWSLRNLDLTGQPFFTLQSVAEAAKDTSAFPGYSVYQGLEPQPLLSFAAAHAEPLARKTARGLRFYLQDAPRYLAWPWLLVVLASPLAGGRGRGLFTAGGTVILLMIFYSPFDHSLRHLLPVFPVLSWELAAFAAGSPAPRGIRPTLTRAGILATVAVIAAVVFPCRLPGWEAAARDAVALQPRVKEEAARLREAPPGVVFTEFSAAAWLADRPSVWMPSDETIRARIVGMLTSDNGRIQP